MSDKPVMSNKCKCGCGGVTNGKWKFLRGHKPKGELAITPSGNQSAEEPTDSFELTLTLSVAQIDALFLRLSPLSKANALTSALQGSADEAA